MKSILKIALLVTAMCIPAMAQRSADLFGATRTLVAAAPQNLIVGQNLVTNTVDLIAFDGVVNLDISSITNSGNTGGTLTATLYGSYDKTNFTAISYANGTNYTVTYTNKVYGSATALTQANTYSYPGSWVNPSVASAGIATPYLNAAQFTNTAALTVTGAGIYHLGFNAADSPRYLHIVWATGGTITNFTTSAVLTGFTHSSQLQ